MSTTAAEQPKVTTLGNWKKAADHLVRLPSGAYVKMRVPDLPALIEAGQIPQNLLDAALGAAGGQNAHKPSRELIVQQREFTDKLVQLTVTEPKLSDEDVRQVPFEDKEMIVELATRQRDLDAEGSHIGGLDKSEKFRRFRGLGSGDEDVEGL